MTLLATTVVGSYPQPDWLIDRVKLAGRLPPRVRATSSGGSPSRGSRRRRTTRRSLAIRDMERGRASTSSPTARCAARATRTASRPRSKGSTSTTRARRSTAPAIRTRCRAWSGRSGAARPVEVRDVEFLRANTDRADQDHACRGRSRWASRRRTTTTRTSARSRWTTRQRSTTSCATCSPPGRTWSRSTSRTCRRDRTRRREYARRRRSSGRSRGRRHEGAAHLLRLRGHRARQARRLPVPRRARRVPRRPDLDRGRAAAARSGGPRAAAVEARDPRRPRPRRHERREPRGRRGTDPRSASRTSMPNACSWRPTAA